MVLAFAAKRNDGGITSGAPEDVIGWADMMTKIGGMIESSEVIYLSRRIKF